MGVYPLRQSLMKFYLLMTWFLNSKLKGLGTPSKGPFRSSFGGLLACKIELWMLTLIFLFQLVTISVLLTTFQFTSRPDSQLPVPNRLLSTIGVHPFSASRSPPVVMQELKQEAAKQDFEWPKIKSLFAQIAVGAGTWGSTVRGDSMFSFLLHLGFSWASKLMRLRSRVFLELLMLAQDFLARAQGLVVASLPGLEPLALWANFLILMISSYCADGSTEQQQLGIGITPSGAQASIGLTFELPNSGRTGRLLLQSGLTTHRSNKTLQQPIIRPLLYPKRGPLPGVRTPPATLRPGFYNRFFFNKPILYITICLSIISTWQRTPPEVSLHLPPAGPQSRVLTNNCFRLLSLPYKYNPDQHQRWDGLKDPPYWRVRPDKVRPDLNRQLGQNRTCRGVSGYNTQTLTRYQEHWVRMGSSTQPSGLKGQLLQQHYRPVNELDNQEDRSVCNCLLKKKLSKYFNNLNEEDIEVSLLVHHHIKLRNMSLKTSLFSSEDELLVPTECRVGYLELEFDFSKLDETPLSIKVTNANIILKFNENAKETKPQNDTRTIKDYHHFLKMKEDFGYKSFFERKKEQLKDWLIGILAQKTSLFIKDIQLAVEYPLQDRMHYIGVTLEDVNIKSRTIINEQSVNNEEKFVQLTGLGMFVGIQNQVNLIKKQGENRETWVLKRSINKLYFLKHCLVSFRLNLFDRVIEADIENFVMNATPTALKQIMEFSRYIIPLLNRVRPKTKPGEGTRIRVGELLISQGSADWWKYLSLRVMELISKKRRYNILLNPSYRKYLFCLLLTLVYKDTNMEVLDQIHLFQVNRPILETLKARQYLIERINSIQIGLDYEQAQNKGFIRLIGNFKKVGYLGSRQVKYSDIEKSRRWNIQNGRNYIKKLEIENLFKFRVRVVCKRISIFVSENSLLYDFVKLNKLDKLSAKSPNQETRNQYLKKVGGNFLKHALNELNQGFKKDHVGTEWDFKSIKKSPYVITLLEVKNTVAEIQTNSKVELTIEGIQVSDLNKTVYQPEVISIKRVSIQQTLLSREMRAASLDQQNAKISVRLDHFSFTAQKPFIEKLIFLMGLVQLDIATIETVSQFQKTMREALYENISKSSKKGANSNDISVVVRKLNVMIPCDYSSKGNILGLELTDIALGVHHNIHFVEVFSIRLAMVNSFVWRNQNSFSMINDKQEKLKESVIVNLGQMKIENKNVMDRKSASNHKLGPSIFSVTDFLIPIICIQISIKQLFLIHYLLTLWKTTHFTPLASLYVKSPLKRRKNHEYLSQNESILVNNVIQRLSFNIMGIVVSFTPIKKYKEQALFLIFFNSFELLVVQKSFSSSMEAKLSEVYVQNISNHLPINKVILDKFMQRLLRDGDRLPKARNGLGMDSLNLMLDNDISRISPKESFRAREGSLGISFDQEDPQEVLNAFEFREGEKNYFNKKLILMTEGEKFLKVHVSDFYNLESHQQQKLIKVSINPFHIVFQVIFFGNLSMILDTAAKFSAKKLENFYEFMKGKGIIPLTKKVGDGHLSEFIEENSEERSLLGDRNVIIDAKLSKYTKVQLNVSKIVLMIFHHNTVIYCFKLAHISGDLQEKHLYSDMNFALTSLYVVDTKPDSGRMQQVAVLKGPDSSMKIHIRTFKNQTLIVRRKCKTSAQIKITGLEVVFLKKKIIQLVDTLRYFMDQLKGPKDTTPRQTQTETQAQPAKPKEPGFHFALQITSSKVLLVQSSIQDRHLVGIADSILISNNPQHQPATMEEDLFKEGDVFEECSAMEEVAEDFKSFQQEKQEELDSDSIYIGVKGFNLYDQFDEHQLQPIASAQSVTVEINTTKEVRIDVHIADLDGRINQNQYTFVMRTVDQNLDQSSNNLRPKGPISEALGIAVSVSIGNTVLQLDIPNYDIVVQSKGMEVKVYMYDNDSKEIKFSMYNIIVSNVVKSEQRVIFRSFAPEDPASALHEKSFRTQLVMLRDDRRFAIEQDLDMRDIIKERTRIKMGEEIHSLRMSLIQGRDKFERGGYQLNTTSDTNYQRLVRCLGRFCCNCLGLQHRSRKEDVYQEEIRSNQRLIEEKGLNADIPLKAYNNDSERNPSDFKGEHIEDERLILRRKVFPHNVFDKNQAVEHQFLKVYMQSDSTFQKVKKVRVSNVGVNIEEHSIIKVLLAFVKQPFTVANPRIKTNTQFNRFPPNTLDIELQNMRFVIGRDMDDHLYNSIEILMNLKFMMQDQGDTKFGPGLSKWEVNAAMNVNYCKGNKDNEYIPISLCKEAKLVYTKNIKVPYFKLMDQIYEKKQQVYLSGQDKQIHFKFPLVELKVIRKLINKLNQTNQSSDPAARQRPVPPPVPFNWTHNQLKFTIPSITLELQRGLARALVEVSLSNMYLESEGVSFKDTENQKKTSAYGTISGNYVNMSSGNVQPFIENWTFELKTQQTFKDAQLIKLVKLSSRGQEDKLGTNTLNINVTTSLLKNLKDAESRYKNQGVVLDDCFKNLLDRHGQQAEIPEFQQDDLVRKYRFAQTDHRNFFGKKFVRLKGGKKLGQSNQTYWNIQLEPFVMFHSFLDQSTGLKLVHLRTPLSIRNICGTPVKLKFMIRKKSAIDNWSLTLANKEAYCIPLNVYYFDYLVRVTLDKQPPGKPVSVLALLKEFEERSQFQQLLDQHPLFQRAFRLLQGNPPKYIAKNDTIVKAGNNLLLAACVKIMYKLQRMGYTSEEERAEDVFETQVLLVPPLIIKNQLSMKLEMFVQDRMIVIQPNSEKVIIDLPQNLLGVQIYFKKVTSSKRFSIFAQVEPVSVYKIHISEGYNINMKCVRMSQLSRCLVIYSNYIIKNFTFENFEIFHKGNKILLERSYWFFITQDEDKPATTKFSEINFYKGLGDLQKFDPNLKKQGIRLTKMDPNEIAPIRIRLDDDTAVLPGDEQDLDEDKKGRFSRCCAKKKKNISVNQKARVYDFVIWIKTHPGEISRTLCIYYKYEVKNNSEDQFVLYHEDVEVFQLAPGDKRYLFQYESESDRFRVGCVLRTGIMTYSRPFKIDLAQDFMVKILDQADKLYPYDRNHLLRVIISEQQDLFLIEFNTPPPKEEFMMFLQNSTMHNARIKETDEDFTLPPKEKIPFFWSNLDFGQSNKLFVEIEGHSKQFKMNELDSFQPLVLEQFKNQPQNMGVTYKKGFLRLNYKRLNGEYLCVCDVLRQSFIIYHRVGTEYKITENVKLLQAAYMNTNGNFIYVYLPDGMKMALLAPSDEESTLWREVINNSLTVRTFHKIMLRMESTDYARILKLYELKGDESKTVKRIEYSIAIDSVSVTLINSIPSQIVLLGCEKLKVYKAEQFRSNNQDSLVRVKNDYALQIGKMKLNNNIQDTENPVIQAGSKKSENPYFQVKAVRTYYRNFSEQEMSRIYLMETKDQEVNHYNEVGIFLDETQIIIDNANYAEIKKIIEELNKMIELYSVNDEDNKVEKDVDIRQTTEFLRYAHDKGLYINKFTIEPMKFVLSANWTSSNSELTANNHLAILKAMPFGIDHAVVQLKGFVSYHINQNSDILLDRLKRHYTQDIMFQILKNAGSYDLLVPLKIIGGVGTGARDIFYDPIYTLFMKRDIKSSSSKVLEGCVGFISTIVEVLFKFIYVIFKIMAFLTFDTSYNARRNGLLRRTMKSPKFAIVHAGIFYLKLFPEVIAGFYRRPKQQYLTRGIVGVPFGLFSALMGFLKPVTGVYDFLYCLWFGFVNIADYEEQPMKFRTRPVRIFKNQIVRSYNQYQALAHEVMKRNKIQEIKNEFIQFSEEIRVKGKPLYIIITNYRLITSKETLSYNSIKFYKIKSILRIENTLSISLNIADLVSCCVCFKRKKRDFKYIFDQLDKAELVEEKLKDAINKNSQNPLEKSQVLKDIPVGRTTLTSRP